MELPPSLISWSTLFSPKCKARCCAPSTSIPQCCKDRMRIEGWWASTWHSSFKLCLTADLSKQSSCRVELCLRLCKGPLLLRCRQVWPKVWWKASKGLVGLQQISYRFLIEVTLTKEGQIGEGCVVMEMLGECSKVIMPLMIPHSCYSECLYVWAVLHALTKFLQSALFFPLSLYPQLWSFWFIIPC